MVLFATLGGWLCTAEGREAGFLCAACEDVSFFWCAAEAAVPVVAAAGSFAKLVGDLGAVADLGDDAASFFTPLVLGFSAAGASLFGCSVEGLVSCFFIASLASLALFAESITPLIFAGPPRIFIRGATGDVGVFTDFFGELGDTGDPLCCAGFGFGFLTG